MWYISVKIDFETTMSKLWKKSSAEMYVPREAVFFFYFPKQGLYGARTQQNAVISA